MKILFTEFSTLTFMIIIGFATVVVSLIFKWLTRGYVKRSFVSHHKDLTGYCSR